MDLYAAARDFPGSLRGGARIVSTAQIADAGVSPTALRWHTGRGRLVRAHRGTYLIARGEPDLLDRVRAELSDCPTGTVVGYHTAAALLGFGVPEDPDVHVVVPAGAAVPRRPGLRTHESVLAFDPCERVGVRCTPPARTAIDLARSLDRATALAVLDAALFAGACSPGGLAAEVLRHETLRGIRQARELVALADGRAECRQESHLRLILHDAGLVGWEPQVEIFEAHSPYPAFRVDLANRTHRVAAEYDGRSHTRDSLRGDRRRHNRLSELGWRMRYFTDHDLYRDPGSIVSTLRRATQLP